MGLDLQVCGQTAGAIAFGGQVIAGDGVPNVMGRDTRQGDHIAFSWTAGQDQHVQLFDHETGAAGTFNQTLALDRDAHAHPARIGGLRSGGQRHHRAIARGQRQGAGRIVDGFANLRSHIGIDLVSRAIFGAAFAVCTQVILDHGVAHIGRGQTGDGDDVTHFPVTRQAQNIVAYRCRDVGTDDATIAHDDGIGVTVLCGGCGRPAQPTIGGADNPATVHRGQNGLTIL